MFQTSVSDILLLKPFMSNFGPAPSRMTRKISPSVDPRSHLSSVRFDGCVPSGAIGPLPFASALWQNRQFFWNSACPALIDSGDDGTGFFMLLPSALPPGFCAETGAASSVASTSADVAMSAVEKRRRIGQRSPLSMRIIEVPILCQRPARLQRAVFGPSAYAE